MNFSENDLSFSPNTESVEVSGDPILWKSSSTNPGASLKVKFDDLEVLQACDIDQNLKFLHAFLSQNGYHFRFSNFGGLKTIRSLQISSQKLLDPLQLFKEL